jgi:dUTP pyrophosphatase
VSEPVPVPIRLLDPDLPPPRYAHPGDAGADLVAAEGVEIPPGGRSLVRTGVAIALPVGYVGLVHPRSGLAARMGVTVLNAPGTVDAGYRGEILVNLVNHDRDSPAKITACRSASGAGRLPRRRRAPRQHPGHRGTRIDRRARWPLGRERVRRK